MCVEKFEVFIDCEFDDFVMERHFGKLVIGYLKSINGGAE